MKPLGQRPDLRLLTFLLAVLTLLAFLLPMLDGAARTQQVGILAEEGTARILVRANTIQNNAEADVQGDVEVSQR